MKMKTHKTGFALSLLLLMLWASSISTALAEETGPEGARVQPLQDTEDVTERNIEPGAETLEKDAKDAAAEGPLPSEGVPADIVEEEKKADGEAAYNDEQKEGKKESEADGAKKERRMAFSDFVDTKISFSYADDNLRDNSEFSPAARIGQKPSSEIVGESGEIRPTDINHTHLVIHHKSDGYLPGILTEAALVLQLKLATDPNSGEPESAIGDDGSFVRVGYIFDHAADKSMILDLTGFPFDAERFIMGYHYNLTWGGETSFPQNRDPVPGLRLGFEHPAFYVFAGFKTHLQPKKDKMSTERVPNETVYAFLGGFGLRPFVAAKRLISTDALDGFLIEANGGMIDKGDNPNMQEDPKDGERDDIIAWGLSSRISYSLGIPIGDRMDLNLYENDPRTRLKLARSDVYEPGALSFAVSVEGNYLSQNLQDPNPDQIGGTKPFVATAALVSGKLKYDYFRFHLEGSYRSLEFLLFDTPGFVPFQSLPAGAEKSPELYGVVSVDYHIAPAYLTLGITAGYKRPAAYRGNKDAPVSVVKRRTTSSAYISPFNRPIENLPPGKNAFDILEAKFDAQLDLSDFMTFMFEISYTLDNNMAKLVTDPDNSELLKKEFEDSSVTNRIGVAAIIQAKF